ncbi:isocitrate lyase/phosphoenolpyruvate mutase family protein [Sinomonas sp. G460-2]|uniref:isocitrate lyase/phosphoenolpyruvate mutase family protein n=1 Tax=Sinomonas sp. G460-2 TaxID=3393464 RepID=UPI0039F02BB1
MTKAAHLRRLIEEGRGPVLTAGAHDGLGAVLAERAGYRAIWASGLEISAAHALPDAGLLGISDYLAAARIMNQACGLPVIADCDTGFGNELNAAYTVQQYEAAGIAAICIEDKVFPKVNSFADHRQMLVPIAEFTHKIRVAKATQTDPDFMVIARTESLIAGSGMDEALRRAHAYADAGADAILIHSKAKTHYEVEEFMGYWAGRLPVVIVPTTYYEWTARDAGRAGASIVIHANQGLRATVSAVTSAFTMMLNDGCSSSLEGHIASVKEIFELQRMDQWLELEA